MRIGTFPGGSRRGLFKFPERGYKYIVDKFLSLPFSQRIQDVASKLWLIQGVFFQNQSWLGIAMKPIEGTVAVINRALCQFQFSGIIELATEDNLGQGILNDVFGTADLTSVSISDTHLFFKKRYAQRDDAIDYQFSIQPDGTWAGEYRGERVGSGKARCVLTPVTKEFFTIPQ